jgi:hypothetical protein
VSNHVDRDGFVTQGDAIRHYVFPLCNIEVHDDGLEFKEFLGTGFFIGARGHALTAAHVVRNARQPAIMMPGQDGGWHGFQVLDAAFHPTEDIALLRIEPLPDDIQWRSIFTLPTIWAGSSMTYFLFSYPESAFWEIVENDMAQGRPDLIYSEGHIRRRVSGIPLPTIKGSKFLELSQVAGAGCSGSPVIYKTVRTDDWQLVGLPWRAA